METTDLERRFAEFKISKRARSLVQNNYGSLGAVAVAVRKRETHPCVPEVGGFYTLGGVRDAVEFGYFLPDRRIRTDCGVKTVLEIAKALLILGAATFDDCFPKQRDIDLKDRLKFNEELKALGWTGPFLDGPKRVGRNPAETKAIRLRERMKRLGAQLAQAERELESL